MDGIGREAEPDLTATPLRRTAVQSFAWAFVALVGNRFVVFAGTVVLARILVPEDFGVVAAALVLLTFLQVSLDLGVGAALVQLRSDDLEAHADTAFTLNVLLAGVAAGVLAIAAPFLADGLGVSGNADLLRVAGLAVVFRALGQTHDALLRRRLDFRSRTVVEIGRALVRTAVAITLAMAGAGPWALIIGTLASEATAAALLWFIEPFRPRLTLARASMRVLLGFGGAVTALRLVSEVVANTDYLVIGSQLGAIALGFYSIAFRLPELIIGNVLVTLSQVAFPVLSRARDDGRAGVVAIETLRWATLFGFTTAAGLAIVADDSVSLVFGSAWEASAAPMVVLAIAMGIGSVGYGVGDLFLAQGRPMIPLALNAAIALPAVAAFVLAAPHGIVAVAWVHVAIACVSSTMQVRLARRMTGFALADVARSFRGPVAATAGILILALPVRMLLPPGLGRLAAAVALGCVGALIGAHLGDRRLMGDLRFMAAQIGPRS
jgi:lipopolysaccharide exporter